MHYGLIINDKMVSVLSHVLYWGDFRLLFSITCSAVNFFTVSVVGMQEELHFDKINAENKEHVRSRSFIMSPTCRNYYFLSYHFYRIVYILKYLPTGIKKIKCYVLLLKLKVISWRNLLVLKPKRTKNPVISA